jgi:hypothetical protein
MTEDFPWWLPLFPIFFAAVWLFASVILGLMTGWFSLQQWYEEPSGKPLLQMRGLSGGMGFGVSLGGILRLGAHPTGLAVGISRVFAPFQRPFLVPWSEIQTEPTRTLFTPMVRLRFGNPPSGSLKISALAWSKLVTAAKASSPAKLPDVPPITGGQVARGMLFEWVSISAVGGLFFFLVSRSGPGPGIPLAICIGLPAVVVGIGQLFRYAKEH